MSTLALVYAKDTGHILTTTLVQSGFASTPAPEVLVGSGVPLRNTTINASGGDGTRVMNVAGAKLNLAVAKYDVAKLAVDLVNKLLTDPMSCWISDPSKPPNDTFTTTLKTHTLAAAGIAVALPSIISPTLPALAVVQHDAFPALPSVTPLANVGGQTADQTIGTGAVGDWALLLVMSAAPVFGQLT